MRLVDGRREEDYTVSKLELILSPKFSKHNSKEFKKSKRRLLNVCLISDPEEEGIVFFWHHPNAASFHLKIIRSLTGVSAKAFAKFHTFALRASGLRRCHLCPWKVSYDPVFLARECDNAVRTTGHTIDVYMPLTEDLERYFSGRPSIKEISEAPLEERVDLSKLRQTKIEEFFKPRRLHKEASANLIN